MRESEFTSEVMRSLRAQDIWAHKIADAPISKIKGMKFTLTKPCDIVACANGNFIAIETKQIKKWRAFSIKDMRPSQIVNLSQVVKAGGQAFIFLNVRIPNEENRLIIIDWGLHGEDLARESLKADELKIFPYLSGFSVNQKTFFDLSGQIFTTMVARG